jgi:alanine racemase
VLDRLRPAQARVDLSRLRSNFRAVESAARLPVIAVVKSDAYGHGAVRVGRALEAAGAAMLAVAYAEEGVALRTAGLKAPILVLAGFGPAQVGAFVDYGLTPVVSTGPALDAILEAVRGARKPLGVHVEVDTGMNRLGFGPEGIGSVLGRLLDSGRVEVEGIMTHLSVADEDREATNAQLDRFDEALLSLRARGIAPSLVHAGNSAGIGYVRPGHTHVRPGLLLYGLKPRPLSPAVAVQPVMTVSARIALIKDVAPGTTVSYGGKFRATRQSRIATLPIGYADGVPRTKAMAETGAFLVEGQCAPVAGNVCMDLTMVDVTDLPSVREGDEAVLFGDAPTAWDVAECAGANAWQVLTAVGPRVPRVYLDEGQVVGVESRFIQ